MYHSKCCYQFECVAFTHMQDKVYQGLYLFWCLQTILGIFIQFMFNRLQAKFRSVSNDEYYHLMDIVFEHYCNAI